MRPELIGQKLDIEIRRGSPLLASNAKTKPVPTSMFLVVKQLKLHVETSKKAQFTTFNVRHKNIRTASKPCHFRLQKTAVSVRFGFEYSPRFRFWFRLP